MDHVSEARARILARRFAAEVDHLVDCSDCLERVRELSTQEETDYRTALARAAEDTMRRLPRVSAEKFAAPTLMAELLSLAEPERETAIAVEVRFHSYALASYMLRRCESGLPHDPDRFRELARLARGIIDQVDPRSCGGTAALADLTSYALALEGEALRIDCKLQPAMHSFAEARLHQQRGGADPDLAARVDLLEAATRRDLGQYETALDLLDQAADGFMALREHDQLARTILHRASVLRSRGSRKEAEEALESAMRIACDPPARQESGSELAAWKRLALKAEQRSH